MLVKVSDGGVQDVPPPQLTADTLTVAVAVQLVALVTATVYTPAAVTVTLALLVEPDMAPPNVDHA